MKDTKVSRPDLADDATTSPPKDEEKHLDAGSGDAKEAPARSITGIKVSPRVNACPSACAVLLIFSYHSGSLWSSQFSPAPFSSPSTTLLSQTCSPMLSKPLATSPCCPGLVSALPSVASLSSPGVKLTAYSMSNGSSCKSYRFKPALSRLHLDAT